MLALVSTIEIATAIALGKRRVLPSTTLAYSRGDASHSAETLFPHFSMA